MKEIHGVADAKKIVMVGAIDEIRVEVTDGPSGTVDININSQAYAARMTPEQADFLASHLVAAADRARKNKS